MDVKAWVILGSMPQTTLSSPVMPPFRFDGKIMDAAQFPEGQMADWRASPTDEPVTLVCVRLPIVPGRE